MSVVVKNLKGVEYEVVIGTDIKGLAKIENILTDMENDYYVNSSKSGTYIQFKSKFIRSEVDDFIKTISAFAAINDNYNYEFDITPVVIEKSYF